MISSRAVAFRADGIEGRGFHTAIGERPSEVESAGRGRGTRGGTTASNGLRIPDRTPVALGPDSAEGISRRPHPRSTLDPSAHPQDVRPPLVPPQRWTDLAVGPPTELVSNAPLPHAHLQRSAPQTQSWSSTTTTHRRTGGWLLGPVDGAETPPTPSLHTQSAVLNGGATIREGVVETIPLP